MKRKVLVIPKDEILEHFRENTRQEIKNVPPDILTRDLFELLKAKGIDVKPECHLDGDSWTHSKRDEPNKICESRDFSSDSLPANPDGPFAVSFANEKAAQDAHYHERHVEIYYSDLPYAAEYRILGEGTRKKQVSLPDGGLTVFGTEVVHRMQLRGLTVVIEVPALAKDKVEASV